MRILLKKLSQLCSDLSMVFSVSFLGEDFHQIEHHRSEVLIYFIA